MIKQLFKIMWHRKGRNFLLLTEIFFSFMVLFLTGTFMIESLLNYYKPAGFDYTDVYEIDFRHHGESNEEASARLQQIGQVLEKSPQISHYSLSSVNTPYSYNVLTDEVKTEGKAEWVNSYLAQPEYLETLDMELAEGRWFQKGDAAGVKAAVINETLRDKLFPSENPLGQKFKVGEDDFQVVGVVKHFRQDGELAAPENAYFKMYNENDTSGVPSKILLEIKAGAEEGWQQPLLDNISRIAPNWTADLTPMHSMRADIMQTKLIPIISLAVVSGFLIFNVALGLFGVLWYNINKRYAEIGIRRALGATETAVRWQMLGEVMVLATLGLSLGVVLALQFPLLGVMNVESYIYAFSITAALALIYLLVIVCAWFPSKQAARIEPAMALHFE